MRNEGVTVVWIMVLLVGLSNRAAAQNSFIPVSMDSVKALTIDAASPYFYPKLLARYNNFDSTLTDYEYRLVYYGFAFQDAYLKNQPDEIPLIQLANNEDYEAVTEEALRILKQNPVSLTANFQMGYALYQTEREKGDWEKYRDRYYAILKAIASSGNGLTPGTAFTVLYIRDEYAMIYDYFKIPEIHIQTCCDVFEVEEGEYYKAREIYFDITPKFFREQQLEEFAVQGKTAALMQKAEQLLAQGKYAEAEPLFRRALAIEEAALGTNHPYLGTTLNNLALLLQEQGKYAEAEPLFRRALEIAEAALGPDHPDVAQVAENLAAVLHHLGREDKAQQLEEPAAGIGAAH